MKSREFERKRWMAAYEREVLRLAPQLAGKIDWDTATFHYNQNYSAILAAERCYIALQEREG